MKWLTLVPVGLPGLVVLMICGVAFGLAVLTTRLRRGPADAGAERRSGRSWLGVMTQGFAMMLVGFGPIRIQGNSQAPGAVFAALIVLLLAGGAVALFVASARTMGKNWSLVARTRSDHSLVTTGPFGLVRHPIYLAMALFMFGMAVAFGHYLQLLVSVPLFTRGAWLRIRDEEALLRDQFGADYDAYARRVSRFVPGLF